MLLTQLGMPATRYAFVFLIGDEICQKQEGIISYLIGAKRQYIDKKKNKSKNRRIISPLILALLLYKVSALAHNAIE